MKKACKICDGKIKSDILYKGDYDAINVSTAWAGESLTLEGHKTCLKNVNEFVIIPNRIAIAKLRKILSH